LAEFVEEHVAQVDASEAESGRERLPDRVGRDGEAVVTPDGKEAARAAAQRIRDMGRGVTLREVSIRQLIDEGRR
jgi:hypothetical protein